MAVDLGLRYFNSFQIIYIHRLLKGGYNNGGHI